MRASGGRGGTEHNPPSSTPPQAHVAELLAIPGARLLFGGKELQGHAIPKCYGAIEPTAVFVPLKEALKKKHFGVVTKEVFGPLQARQTRRGEACWGSDEGRGEVLGSVRSKPILSSPPPHCICTPGQVVTEYRTTQLDSVLTAMEGMSEHLTGGCGCGAAVAASNPAVCPPQPPSSRTTMRSATASSDAR